VAPAGSEEQLVSAAAPDFDSVLDHMGGSPRALGHLRARWKYFEVRVVCSESDSVGETSYLGTARQL